MQEILSAPLVSHPYLTLRQAPRPRRGLTRAEALWAILLLAAVTVTILGTLSHELTRARQRRAEDDLQYLAGNLRLVLGTDCAPWPADHPALIGPGAPPADTPRNRAPLAILFPSGFYLPTDPWGHAFVLRWEEREGRPDPILLCGGKAGSLASPDAFTRKLAPFGGPSTNEGKTATGSR